MDVTTARGLLVGVLQTGRMLYYTYTIYLLSSLSGKKSHIYIYIQRTRTHVACNTLN